MTPFTVDDLNPRGQVVKTMEMAVRRGRALRVLCMKMLDHYEGNHEWARNTSPWDESIMDKGELLLVFGEPIYEGKRRYAHLWPWFYDQWSSGAMERQELVALSLLPSSVRSKLDAKA
jgi:hypothetical protein